MKTMTAYGSLSCGAFDANTFVGEGAGQEPFTVIVNPDAVGWIVNSVAMVDYLGGRTGVTLSNFMKVSISGETSFNVHVDEVAEKLLAD